MLELHKNGELKTVVAYMPHAQGWPCSGTQGPLAMPQMTRSDLYMGALTELVRVRARFGETSKKKFPTGSPPVPHPESLWTLNISERSRPQLLPGTKILENDSVAAEKSTFEVCMQIFNRKIFGS